MRKNRFFVVLTLAMGAVFALAAGAQQITGTLGSPSATTTIDGATTARARSEIRRRDQGRCPATRSRGGHRASCRPRRRPTSCSSSRMTPASACRAPSAASSRRPRWIASRTNGLRYNNIHSTALCSPTRAALITGRNHHSAGFGVISEQSTGFPGYNSIIAEDKATIGRILLDNGYATSWFGKDHNTPAFAASQVGPFDQWPTGMGFEYFYGFVGGDANQWQPNLFRNTTQIYPFEGKPGWNLITGMADDAIDYLNRINQTMPEQAVLRQVRARRHARAASPDQGMGGEDQRHAPLRRGLEQAARADLREPEEARRDPAGHPAGALADERPQELGRSARPRRRSSSSSRWKSSPPTPPTTTTRSGASSRPSRTWASSTTRSSSTSTATTAPAPRAARSARPTRSRSSTAST